MCQNRLVEMVRQSRLVLTQIHILVLICSDKIAKSQELQILTGLK